MGNSWYILSAGLEFFFAAVSVVLLIGCLFDHDRDRPVNRMMIAILIIHALMNAIDACVWIWCDVPAMLVHVKIWSFLSYGLGCAIFALFSFLLISCIDECTAVAGWVRKAVLALSAFMALMWFISLFNGMYYYWDENGVCQNGPLFWLSQALDMLFLAADILLVVVYRRALRKKDRVVFILYSAIPLLAFGFQPVWEVTPLYMASTISLLLYFTIVHVEHGQNAAEQKEQLARQELELANSRATVMLTQIQPHFLYNSLTAIAQLCEDDPKRAKETTIHFSEYLRRNMSALEQREPISFEKELEHVRIYLFLEQVRFGDELRVAYDIGTTDFDIPPLCLQPIVENAVKHGVGMKEGGGTVTIRTRALPDSYLITVSDDGVGFDPARVPDDGKMHIGIQNVKERLDRLMGAAVRVESAAGRGTDVTIYIPKKEAV